MPPEPRRQRLYWAVVFDRGRTLVSRAFMTREEAVVYATLHLAAERVEVVEAADAAEAERIARRSR